MLPKATAFYLGTTDYLTSPVSGKVEAWTHYNEWGLITHNAVLKCGQRELDLVKRYATHDYDSVLELYYAKARFYDAHDRRFTAVDPILDPGQYDLREYVKNPVQFVQYPYVGNMPVIAIDLLGEYLIYSLSKYIDGDFRYLIVPEEWKHIFANVVTVTVPFGSWSRMFAEGKYGVVGGDGSFVVDGSFIATIFDDAKTATDGLIKLASDGEYLGVLDAISKEAGNFLTKVGTIKKVFDGTVATLNTNDRIIRDKKIVQILEDTGYGLVYESLNSAKIAASTVTNWIDEHLSFFEEPFIKLVCGGGSKQTGKIVGMTHYFPTYWEISSKAQHLSEEEYAEYIDDILFAYKTYLPMAFKYPDDPDNYERFSEAEQNQRIKLVKAVLRQSNMQVLYQSQIKSIGERIKENLKSDVLK